MQNEFKNIPVALPGQGISSEDFNTTKGFSKSFEGARAELSLLKQSEILEEVFDANVSEERLKEAGIDREEALSLLRNVDDFEDPKSFEGMSIYGNPVQYVKDPARKLNLYNRLIEAGIDPTDLVNRQKAEIKRLSDVGRERIGFFDSLAGGALGFAADPTNVISSVGAGYAAIKGSAALGVKAWQGLAAIGALTGAVSDSIIATGLRTEKSIMFENILGGVVGSMALPVLGKTAKNLFKSGKAVLRDTLDSSKLTRDIVKKARVIEKEVPESNLKANLKDELDHYEVLGGRIEDAATIRGKIVEEVDAGAPVSRGKIENLYRVEMGKEVLEAPSVPELVLKVRKTLTDSGKFSEDQINMTITRLENQEFVGNTGKYTVVTEKTGRYREKYTDINGNPKTADMTTRRLVFDTRELAEEALSKRDIENGKVMKLKSGKYGVMQDVSDFKHLEGTRRFPSKEAAESSIAGYAHRFGLDKEDMFTFETGTKSKNPDIKSDWLIGYEAPVSRFEGDYAPTNTSLDRMVITKGKGIVESSETAPDVYKRSLDRKLPSQDEVDTILDQVLGDDTLKLEMGTDLKRFNGMHKRNKKALDEIIKGCRI